MSIVVKKAGVQTTIQDLGRFGFGNFGIQTSGPMDVFSHKLSNLLVGNENSEAAFEIAITGPTLYFRSPAIIAVTGGSFELKVNGSSCPMRRPVGIPAHSELKFGNRVNGVRAYLAVAGGFEVADMFSSKATNISEGFGGYYGRALKRGDEIICSRPLGNFKKENFGLHKPFLAPKWFLPNFFELRQKKPSVLRFISNDFFKSLSPESKRVLLNSRYTVLSGSNRIGYRLSGAKICGGKGDDLSRPVTFGAIQLPPDGNPIILMADCQTVGGYPTLGAVISFDHSILAQLAPGDDLTFEEIPLFESQRLYLKQYKYLLQIKTSLKYRTINEKTN